MHFLERKSEAIGLNFSLHLMWSFTARCLLVGLCTANIPTRPSVLVDNPAVQCQKCIGLEKHSKSMDRLRNQRPKEVKVYVWRSFIIQARSIHPFTSSGQTGPAWEGKKLALVYEGEFYNAKCGRSSTVWGREQIQEAYFLPKKQAKIGSYHRWDEKV